MFEALLSLLESGGALGLAALMFVENLFPPIPSEAIVPLAGFLAGQGQMPLWAVIAAASLGSTLGAIFWYAIGRAVGRVRLLHLIDRFGLWATLSRREAESAFLWFEKHGAAAVFWGRLIPGVRTLISLPAGVVAMPFAQFILWTLVGSALWVTVLSLGGLWLSDNHALIGHLLAPVTDVLLGLALGLYFYRLIKALRRR